MLVARISGVAICLAAACFAPRLSLAQSVPPPAGAADAQAGSGIDDAEAGQRAVDQLKERVKQEAEKYDRENASLEQRLEQLKKDGQSKEKAKRLNEQLAKKRKQQGALIQQSAQKLANQLTVELMAEKRHLIVQGRGREAGKRRVAIAMLPFIVRTAPLALLRDHKRATAVNRPTSTPTPLPTWAKQQIANANKAALANASFSMQREEHVDDAMAWRARAVYGKHRPLHTRELEHWERTVTPWQPTDRVRELEDYVLIHDRKRVIDAYQKVIADLEESKSTPADDVELADKLTALARIYQMHAAYDKAEPLLVHALDIRERVLGPNALEVAASATHLGEIYQQRAAYDKSEPMLLRALDIREHARGAMDPDVALSLYSLGLLYLDQGAYGEAAARMSRACEILGKAPPALEPRLASCLVGLAEVLAAKGAYGDAVQALTREADLREARIDIELLPLSSVGRRNALQLLQPETDQIVSLQADAMPGSSPELALTTVLRRKSRLVDAAAGAQLGRHLELTPDLQRKLDDLTAARVDRARQMAQGIATIQKTGRVFNVSGGDKHVREVAVDFAAASATAHSGVTPLAIADIQAKLPGDTVLIELARYRRFDARQTQQPWREARYVAFVLTSQGPARTVVLGDAGPIDAAIDRVTAAMHAPDAAPNPASSMKATRSALRQLYDSAFAPIVASLPAGVAHLIIAPDEMLDLVPFEALLDPKGLYVGERWVVSYVGCGSELARISGRDAPQSPSVLVATPDYDAALENPSLWPFAPLRPLAGSADEARDLAPYFTSTLTAGAATKAALQTLKGPALLHISTHGFSTTSIDLDPALSTKWSQLQFNGASTWAKSVFGASVAPIDSLAQLYGIPTAPHAPMKPSTQPNAQAGLSTPDVARGLSIAQQAAGNAVPASSSNADQDDTLEMDMLALAGANHGLDGVLTAQDVAGLDLHGTQLVVLSACETGVGVLGMRRALALAGAAAQVVSLWRVDDQATRELMRTYYGSLARGMGRAEALQKAKLGLLRQARYAHPYFWAAFVASGDWSQLPAGLLRPGEAP